MLNDYGVPHHGASPNMILHYDNISAINISKNPVQHSCTKHIRIRHHFIKNLVEDMVIKLKHIVKPQNPGVSLTNRQLAKILP